ncbi:helix-turn-helix domain-containing protein [Vagococcus entomophilus]|uniref:Toxin-antitoxin system, antitoxin component, Xre family protein n=1 Tax=Vagococcus entomophilus TaxID=1160095 RepID=A0A430AHA8_9ENTE|nr:helix-turn-helix transcriptional regulator [Vagococcus entomophilus]RSU07278.1 toxin-antitoxin system, antitoxin component, Xre family protein [Vagococcus entomophilus]
MGNNFSKILGSKMLRVSDVNKATGISRTVLSELYYQRTTNIQLETLTKICDYLEISLSELIEYEPINLN